MSTSSVPPTHKALVQDAPAQPPVVKTLPTPKPTPGSAIIKVLYAPIISYMRDVYNGKRPYKYATPLVIGTSVIGRVAATGDDAVLVKDGDLVYFDCTIHGRDDPGAIFLMGLSEGGTDGSRKLMHGEWRDATYAEYAKVPLENVYMFDERKLCGSPSDGGLGYAPEQLVWLLRALVPYGGMRSIGLQAGETIIVAPATGGFGSAAVIVASAMGARVIAMGRNAQALENLKTLAPKVETVQMTGDLESEMAALKKFGKIDAFFDISPAQAQQSTHLKAAIMSLRHEGRVSLMGGFTDEVAIPHRFIMRYDITLKGKWMYSRADNIAFLDLLTNGNIDLHKFVKVQGTYKLEDWEEAFEAAANADRLGSMVMFTP